MRAIILVVPAKDHAEPDRARGRLATDAVDGPLSIGVRGIDNLSAPGDGRAALAVLLADLHALDLLVRSLGLDSGDIPAGVATVSGVTKVELTPGARVPAVLVRRQGVARSTTPASLGVLVESNVFVLTGLDGKAQSLVAEPAGELAVGADLVPEDHGPGAVVRANEVGDVLVAVLLGFVDLDDVAAPWVTDVSNIANTAARSRSAGAEAGPGVLSIIGASSRRSTGGGAAGRGDGGRGGSGSGSGRRSRSGVASVLVDP